MTDDDGLPPFRFTQDEMPPWHHSDVPDDRRWTWVCPQDRGGCGRHAHHARPDARDRSAHQHLQVVHAEPWPVLSLATQVEVPCPLCVLDQKRGGPPSLEAFLGARRAVAPKPPRRPGTAPSRPAEAAGGETPPPLPPAPEPGGGAPDDPT